MSVLHRTITSSPVTTKIHPLKIMCRTFARAVIVKVLSTLCARPIHKLKRFCFHPIIGTAWIGSCQIVTTYRQCWKCCQSQNGILCQCCFAPSSFYWNRIVFSLVERTALRILWRHRRLCCTITILNHTTSYMTFTVKICLFSPIE